MKIGNVTLDVPVMNAACSVAKSFADVEAMAKTRAGAVLIGSITVEPRTINPAPNLQLEDYYSLNSFGMPNKGFEYYKQHLPKMVQIIRDAGKKAILSIAGFSVDDYRQLACLGDEVDLLELNLGCPNVAHSGILSFDLTMIDKTLAAVKQSTRTPILVKVSPYSDPGMLKQVATIFIKHTIAAVTTSNTFPNGIFTYGQSDKKYAGISGKALMPIALGQVHQFRSLLPDAVAVIGVGGIESKQDVQMYLDAGASAVQVATLIVRDGHAAIDRTV